MKQTIRKAAFAACSDPLSEAERERITALERLLEERGFAVTGSPYLFGCAEPDPGKKKAEILNRYFMDPEMEFIFDVSGGDLANTVLRHLDYEAIRNSRACLCGYSDLTAVINAIYAKTGREAVNYQIKHLARGTDEMLRYFDRAVLGHDFPVQDLEVNFLRGTSMQGRVLGGNVRCMLKLAGTPYWPDLHGAILLLEANGGGVNQMTTMLEQYLELGAAQQISGVLLGTFTKMEKSGAQPDMKEIARRMFPEEIPIAETRRIGHGKDARAIVIGREITLSQ